MSNLSSQRPRSSRSNHNNFLEETSNTYNSVSCQANTSIPNSATQSTSQRTTFRSLPSSEWLPYDKEEDVFLPFNGFDDIEKQMTYELILNSGKLIITNFASTWYFYQQRIQKTVQINDESINAFSLSTFLETQYAKARVCELRMNAFAEEIGCDPFFPNTYDVKRGQLPRNNDNQPTFQVRFPTFGQDSNSIKDLSEFLDLFDNALEEAKISPLKYRQRFKACLGGDVLNFFNESISLTTSWKDTKHLIDLHFNGSFLSKDYTNEFLNGYSKPSESTLMFATRMQHLYNRAIAKNSESAIAFWSLYQRLPENIQLEIGRDISSLEHSISSLIVRLQTIDLASRIPNTRSSSIPSSHTAITALNTDSKYCTHHKWCQHSTKECIHLNRNKKNDNKPKAANHPDNITCAKCNKKGHYANQCNLSASNGNESKINLLHTNYISKKLPLAPAVIKDIKTYAQLTFTIWAVPDQLVTLHAVLCVFDACMVKLPFLGNSYWLRTM
jgi:hypothetical protein